MGILTQNEVAVNILADGVHEYDDPTDKWVVIVNLEEVAWTGTQAAGWQAYNEIIRVEREHVERNLLNGYQVPASSGYHAEPTVTAPPFTLLEVTQADIDAVERGNKPEAWRATSREELPSGWPMARVKR